jgi:hypothetical protein
MDRLLRPSALRAPVGFIGYSKTTVEYRGLLMVQVPTVAYKCLKVQGDFDSHDHLIG